MSIRPAEPSDSRELLRMAKAFHKAANIEKYASWESSEEYWEKWLKHCILDEKALCLVWDDGSRLAGFITAILGCAFWNSNVRTVNECSTWVDRDFRRLGIGTAFTDGLYKWGKSQGACLVSAGTTMDFMPKAIGTMLEKNGFILHEKIYSKQVS